MNFSPLWHLRALYQRSARARVKSGGHKNRREKKSPGHLAHGVRFRLGTFFNRSKRIGAGADCHARCFLSVARTAPAPKSSSLNIDSTFAAIPASYRSIPKILSFARIFLSWSPQLSGLFQTIPARDARSSSAIGSGESSNEFPSSSTARR